MASGPSGLTEGIDQHNLRTRASGGPDRRSAPQEVVPGDNNRHPLVHRLLPDRADWIWERRIAEGSDGNTHRTGLVARDPVQRCAAVWAKVGGELVSGVCNPHPGLALPGDMNSILRPVSADAQYGARTALTGNTVARHYGVRITGRGCLQVAAGALRHAVHRLTFHRSSSAAL